MDQKRLNYFFQVNPQNVIYDYLHPELPTYDAASWWLRTARSWYRTRGVGRVVVAGVARQEAVLLGPTAVVAGLRDPLLGRLHHLLVLASSVLEPNLNLQHGRSGCSYVCLSVCL